MDDQDNALLPPGQGRLLPLADAEGCLDSNRLADLEEAFRRWAKSGKRSDHRQSRERILLIFLIIRYTGARLNEVLSLDLGGDFNRQEHVLRFNKRSGRRECSRDVQIPAKIAADIEEILSGWQSEEVDSSPFRIDPAHVRRKFYERATEIGLESSLGTPETLRKSRAVELLRGNMPLPVVQQLMGHSTPNLTASLVEFSSVEMGKIAKFFAERENRRKTSARNAFFGKITRIDEGSIQSLIEVVSVGGNRIFSIITNGSLIRLGLRPGLLVTAEVKAPWIQLCTGEDTPRCSADNLYRGVVRLINKNHTTVEVVVCLPDTTELCAIISEQAFRSMAVDVGDHLWVFFDAFAVVLHLE